MRSASAGSYARGSGAGAIVAIATWEKRGPVQRESAVGRRRGPGARGRAARAPGEPCRLEHGFGARPGLVRPVLVRLGVPGLAARRSVRWHRHPSPDSAVTRVIALEP